MPNFWRLTITPILKTHEFPLGMLILYPPLENMTTCITIITTYSRPQLTQLRELERSQKIFDETKGDQNKRKFIMKTIQTWFNDFDYDWSGENNHKLVYPNLLKLTRRLELATQLVIGQNKYCATEYQVCIQSYARPYEGLKVRGHVLMWWA